jgi:hypothetical protein
MLGEVFACQHVHAVEVAGQIGASDATVCRSRGVTAAAFAAVSSRRAVDTSRSVMGAASPQRLTRR